MTEPLLLHSMSEHHELIFGALEAAAPTRIVEIGSETGGFTKELVSWAADRGVQVVTVEPYPTPEIGRLAENSANFELLHGRSPEALRGLERAGAYVVDGDHNYWTVSRELEAIFAGAENTPLAILHDVGWPCARRDQYYAPDALPDDAVLPHSFTSGRDPDSSVLVEGGFRGSGQFAVALEEGGPRNGVLTAIEDFAEGRPELEYLELPVVFGVGFVFATAAPYADAVRTSISPWHVSALARRLERNRLRLFARLLALQDELSATRLRNNRTVLAHDERLAAAQAEVAALRLERARLRAQLDADTSPA